MTTSHDVYALGIMAWLLAIGQYKRPSYAESTNVQEIYNASSRQSVPDMDTLPQGTSGEVLADIIVDCLECSISLWDLQEKLNTCIENMNTVTEVKKIRETAL